MDWLLTTLIALASAVLVLWLAMVGALVALRPSREVLREAVRLLPDLVRLVRRLVSDPTLPKAVRRRVWLAAAYLAFPIDIVPDFIPVLGYADDAVVLALMLRSVLRRAGVDPVRRHWPGTERGLQALLNVITPRRSLINRG